MRKYQFSLQAALNLRERAVEQAELALRKAKEDWNANLRAQQALAEDVAAAERSVRKGPLDPADLGALGRFREASARRRLRLAQEATALANRLRERQSGWQAAERDRTLLVRLREKSLARWRQQYEREQQQLSEEAYITRWGR